MNILRNNDGAALMSVLLLVSVMSAAMVAMFDILGFYTSNTVRDKQITQARHYARAAEIIGADQAVKLADKQDLLNFLGENQNAQKVTLPIENGEINGALIERSNCFNLSSLVMKTGDGKFEVNYSSFSQYTRLLENLGLGNQAAAHLAATLTDWQDSDTRPEPGGAEDYNYSQLEVPYRAANAPIADIKELRLVEGYTPELIETLEYFTCVDPVSMETTINLNSLTAGDGLLIQALLGLTRNIQEIETMIAERPASGYDHVSRFWDHRFFEGVTLDQQVRGQFYTRPKRYDIVIDVSLYEVRVGLSTMIFLNNDGTYKLVNRKLGA
ncbi:type II secretion system minor pseudopilin GspK [Pseudemcibacter aquimaris]|uniref:type II secretion system minor pseudopilin GspK n=1 Tax=Pseudemcibacter aquimaris TaxID=2857064 RepID=UPI002012E6AF|nr:type II secretion system minor pseudopilin GspK [Pseudemcibacter aquimaris]MCC3861756.1 type II secretion system minor pseudopilin GspK [Pseudemcibacter aquimaris]WDU58525.1 type II secretion system minor pseudopilin GspK [Pseudemcibacter aquimaris]